jgi:hypothetical protein
MRRPATHERVCAVPSRRSPRSNGRRRRRQGGPGPALQALCRQCGGPLKIVAYVTDDLSITRILDHLGLRPPQQEEPPTREVGQVPVDDEGREIGRLMASGRGGAFGLTVTPRRG